MTLLERIMSRCIEEGECLIWQGTLQKRKGYGQGVPVLRHFERGEWRTIGARKLAWEAQNGPVPAGKIIYGCCGHPHCMLHLKAGTRADWAKVRMKTGQSKVTMDTRAKIAKTRRERYGLPPETIAVAEAMLADGAMNKEVVKGLRISLSSVISIRYGRHKMVRGSSVFHQR